MARSRSEARPLYVGLRVRSLDRSVRFYRTLGFRPTIRRRTALGEFAQLEHPVHRFTLELNHLRPGSRFYEPYAKGSEMDHVGFWVDDVDAWARRLCRAGGKVCLPPFDTGIVIPPRPTFGGRASYVADPDGIWIELMGPRKRRTNPQRPSRAGRAGVR